MNYVFKLFLLAFVFLFSACSSKNEININKQIVSISLNDDIVIATPAKTVKSPISIGLGLGGYVSKHFGVNVGTVFRPDISNDDALNLENAISYHQISLSDLIKTEFKKQMKTDSFYKNKFVPFGANHTIYLYVSKYKLDNSLLSSKTNIKIEIELKILNQNDDLVYSDTQINSIDSDKLVFREDEILQTQNRLVKVLNEAITNTIYKLITKMKEI